MSTGLVHWNLSVLEAGTLPRDHCWVLGTWCVLEHSRCSINELAIGIRGHKVVSKRGAPTHGLEKGIPSAPAHTVLHPGKTVRLHESQNTRPWMVALQDVPR